MAANLFDPKTALLARHAQHVVLIHFPIALFLSGAVFDIAAERTKNTVLASVAYYNLVAAAISALPAVATGLIAWQLQLGGTTPRGILRLHLIFALGSVVAMCLVSYLQVRARRKPQFDPALARLGVEIATAMLIALTAHLGGFVSGINGTG